MLIELLNLKASLAPPAYFEYIEYTLASSGILLKVSVRFVPSGANFNSIYMLLYSDMTSTTLLQVPSLHWADVVTDPEPNDSSKTPSYCPISTFV